MKATVYNQSAEKTTEIELNPKIFGIPEIKPEVIHQVVTAMQSSARSAVASTKTRGEIRGGGRKPWQQKGTGRARAGSIRSPLWRGGGIIFGPRPNRNFSKKVNKKQKSLGLFSVLSDKVKDGNFFVLDNLEIKEAKTRELSEKIAALSAKFKMGRSCLLVMPQKSENLVRASRNLPNVRVVMGSNLNILDIISADSMIVVKDALPVIEKTYLRDSSKLVSNKQDGNI